MTNYEFENILRKKAEDLPIPVGTPDFLDNVYEKNQIISRKKHSYRKIVLAAILSCLLLGATVFAYGEINYGMWIGMIDYTLSGSFGSSLLKKYNVSVPEEMGEFRFHSMSQNSISPRDTSRLESLWKSVYRVLDLNYVSAEEWYDKQIYIDVGSTKQEYWQVYFGYDPETKEKVWNDDNEEDTEAENQMIYSEEYEGFTIYFKSSYDEKGFAGESATWLDEEAEVCYYMYMTGSQEKLMPYVQAIIDENK